MCLLGMLGNGFLLLEDCFIETAKDKAIVLLRIFGDLGCCDLMGREKQLDCLASLHDSGARLKISRIVLGFPCEMRSPFTFNFTYVLLIGS